MYYVVALGHELDKNPVLNVKLYEIATGRKIHRNLRGVPRCKTARSRRTGRIGRFRAS